MNLVQFNAQFTRDRDDAAAPLLWSRAERRAYLNEAVNEACERALLIEDSTTAACCSIALVANQGGYTLHEAVIKVKRVTYNGKVLTQTSTEKLDGGDIAWETRTGVPCEYVLTNQDGIRLVPAPTADAIATAAVIGLTVYRRQLVAIDGDTDSDVDFATLIPIPKIYHMRLLPWVYHLALQKNDTQTIDLDESARQEAIFTANFGERPDANVQTKRRDKRPPVVRCQW